MLLISDTCDGLTFLPVEATWAKERELKTWRNKLMFDDTVPCNCSDKNMYSTEVEATRSMVSIIVCTINGYSM